MQNKYKDEKMPDAERGKWNVQDLAVESVNEMPDETLRKTLRGNENKGDPDSRDVAGTVDTNETPQGREEAKNDTMGKANRNG
jgi:hypothetical protein